MVVDHPRHQRLAAAVDPVGVVDLDRTIGNFPNALALDQHEHAVRGFRSVAIEQSGDLEQDNGHQRNLRIREWRTPFALAASVSMLVAGGGKHKQIDRKSGVERKSGSERVELGGRRSIKKKKI